VAKGGPCNKDVDGVRVLGPSIPLGGQGLVCIERRGSCGPRPDHRIAVVKLVDHDQPASHGLLVPLAELVIEVGALTAVRASQQVRPDGLDLGHPVRPHEDTEDTLQQEVEAYIKAGDACGRADRVSSTRRPILDRSACSAVGGRRTSTGTT
jgi:hypothetical protein